MAEQLVQAPCRADCDWAETGQQRAGLPLFRCAGCGSEWVRSEAWTPVQADLTVPAAVAAEAGRR
jgi:transposase-like protein